MNDPQSFPKGWATQLPLLLDEEARNPKAKVRGMSWKLLFHVLSTPAWTYAEQTKASPHQGF